MCNFKFLKEFDLDGGDLTGTIPQFLTTCFPELNELDLSYNEVSSITHRVSQGVARCVPCLTRVVGAQLTGTLPAFLSEIQSLTELEVESNKVHTPNRTLGAIMVLHAFHKPNL